MRTKILRGHRQLWSVVWPPLLAVVLAGLFCVAWWMVPPLLYRDAGVGPDAELKAITDTRTALLAALIGVGALLTFWINSRVYRVTTRTMELTEQGYITDRYTRAIGQIGSEKLDVRLGGIYALERLAVDSERDHPTVVEVLSAFVREHSTKHAGARLKPATDVQAAVTVLGRLPSRPTVSRGDLNGAILTGAILTGAKFVGANLSNVRLDAAHMVNAELIRADLSAARLDGADLSDARLDEADLTQARLQDANLSGACLSQTDVTRGGLTQELINSARGDGRTRLPPGLQRPDAWMEHDL